MSSLQNKNIPVSKVSHDKKITYQLFKCALSCSCTDTGPHSQQLGQERYSSYRPFSSDSVLRALTGTVFSGIDSGSICWTLCGLLVTIHMLSSSYVAWVMTLYIIIISQTGRKGLGERKLCPLLQNQSKAAWNFGRWGFWFQSSMHLNCSPRKFTRM